MTAIIALKDDRKVYMGADSALMLGNGIMAQSSNKILALTTCLVGFAGAKSVQHLMEARSNIFNGDFSIKHLNEIWRNLIECTTPGTESEILFTNGIDIVWCGNIGGYRFSEWSFECAGSGATICKGAMAMSEGHLNDPQDRIMDVLEIAEKYCYGVKGPFYVECIERK